MAAANSVGGDGCARHERERETEEGESSGESEGRSGRRRSERGGETDLRRLTARMMASLRALRERVLHLGAPWRRGGASGQHGEARERRWPRWCSSAATTTLGGCVRESQRRRGARGESERPGGVRGVADGVQGNERKQEVARGEAGGGRGSIGERHASTLFVLLAEEEEDKGEGGGLGRLGELGRWWRQVRFLFSLCLF